MQGVWIRSLGWELRSHMLSSRGKKIQWENHIFLFWPSKDKLVSLWSNTRGVVGLHVSIIFYIKYISLNVRIILSMWVPSWGKRELGPLRAEQSPISHAFLVSVQDSRAKALRVLTWPLKTPPLPFLALQLGAELRKSASVYQTSLPYPLTPPLFPLTVGREQIFVGGSRPGPALGNLCSSVRQELEQEPRNLTPQSI